MREAGSLPCMGNARVCFGGGGCTCPPCGGEPCGGELGMGLRLVHCGVSVLIWCKRCVFVWVCVLLRHGPRPGACGLLWGRCCHHVGWSVCLASACQPCGAVLVRSRPSACLAPGSGGCSRVLCVLGMPWGNHVTQRAASTACVYVVLSCGPQEGFGDCWWASSPSLSLLPG
jgi:hypothetical protein